MAEDDNKIPIKVSSPVAQQPIPQFDAAEAITMHSPGQTIHPIAHDEQIHEAPDPTPVVPHQETTVEPLTQPLPSAQEPQLMQPEPQTDTHVVSHPHPHHSPGKSAISAILIVIITLLILAAAAAAAIYFLKI